MNVPKPEERPTLTVDETAELLGVSRSSAFQAAKVGEIPTIRIGRRLLVPTAALRQQLGIDPGPIPERVEGPPPRPALRLAAHRV